jgi:16S rRNA (uracil1498-N3)-methyltransferase
MHVFYSPTITEGEIILNPEESLHATKVLRLKEGDEISLTNGSGSIASAVIAHPHDKHTKVRVSNIIIHEPRRYHLHLAVAPNKSADRLEWMLEKMTELGVSELSLLMSKRTIRSNVRMDRVKKIALSAAKQSINPWIPLINNSQNFMEFISTHAQTADCYIAYCGSDKKLELAEALSASRNTNYLILIGPEGDFSDDEINAAIQKGFKPLSLGEGRLRTETAAIYVAAAAKLLLS